MKTFLSLFLLATTFTSFGRETTRENDAIKKKVVVSVIFKNADHAKHFMTWMSEQGEQDMHTWMEEAEPELAKIPTYDLKKNTIDYSSPE